MVFESYIKFFADYIHTSNIHVKILLFLLSCFIIILLLILFLILLIFLELNILVKIKLLAKEKKLINLKTFRWQT